MVIHPRYIVLPKFTEIKFELILEKKIKVAKLGCQSKIGSYPLSISLSFFMKKQAKESLAVVIKFPTNSNCMQALFVQPEYKTLHES